MKKTLIIIVLLALVGCDDSAGCPELQGDSTSDIGTTPDQESPDVTEPDDVVEPEDMAQDTGPPNTPPTFGPLPPITLDMGTSMTLGLAELMDDAEDPDGDLVLSWSGEHVALQEGPGHALLVVAPVDWWGIEEITVTLADSGGLEAAADLTVTVNEVIPPVDPPPETCGEVVFSYTDPAAQLVELAGTFNEWTPDPMDDADGTWTLTKILAPGPWEYKFVVDGDWITDPTNPNKVSDGYGEHNSLLEVPPCPEED